MPATHSEPLDGMRCWSAPGHFTLVAKRFEQSVAQAGLFDEAGFERALANRAGARGRTATALLRLPGSDRRVHVRPFRHGGWLGPLRGEALLGLDRPIAELRVNAELARAGAPVPEPVFVIARRAGGFWRH